jgi:hypothetical protein
MLQRFWFKFVVGPCSATVLECGVTAYTFDDAVSILRATLFAEGGMPEIREVVANIDIHPLDRGQIPPNRESPLWRGVWYPKGHAFPADRRGLRSSTRRRRQAPALKPARPVAARDAPSSSQAGPSAS